MFCFSKWAMWKLQKSKWHHLHCLFFYKKITRTSRNLTGYCCLYCSWQTCLPGFIGTGTKAWNWKSSSLLPPLIQVRELCFLWIETTSTQEFWATFILITWQNSHFIKVIENLNSMLLCFYSSLNKTVNIWKCLYDCGSQSDQTSVSITQVHFSFLDSALRGTFKKYCYIIQFFFALYIC